MLEFEFPWLFCALPLPLLLRLLPARREQRTAVRAPFFQRLVELSGQEPGEGAVVLRPSKLQWLLLALTWILLVMALARPQWVEEPVVRIEAARDMLLAVDLSGSMEAEDFSDPQGDRISRLDAVKQVLDDFIARREGDRIGLLFFGSAPFLQVPFTQDHETVRALLDEAEARMAGAQTMLGDSIGLAIKLFEDSELENRVLILLTDGNDTGSLVPPATAAEIAAEEGITIHTIAIGDPTTVGEDALDIDALTEVAEKTGGRFFYGNDREELVAIYRELDALEPEDFEALTHLPKRPLFQWPLGALLVLTLGYHSVMGARTLSRGRVRIHA